VQGTITNAVRAGLIFFLFYLIHAGTITLGQYFSLSIYSFWLFFPLQQIAPFIAAYRETEASLENYKKFNEYVS
jgi:ATP-binding cassette subfamily B protein